MSKIDILDKMLTSLVEILEEKGVLTQEEWEKKIKEKIDEEVGWQKKKEFSKFY